MREEGLMIGRVSENKRGNGFDEGQFIRMPQQHSCKENPMSESHG